MSPLPNGSTVCISACGAKTLAILMAFEMQITELSVLCC